MKRFIALVGLLLIVGTAQAQSAFDDVRSDHFNREAIQYLQTKKVVEGYKNNQFKPENRVNRAEFIKMIVAAQVANPTGANCFKDVKNEWFAKYVCAANRLGYVTGYPDGTFKPGDYINFAEASKIITKALAVKEDKGAKETWFAPYVKALEAEKSIPSTVQSFDKDLSRGEMAEVLWRLKTDQKDRVSLTYEEITEAMPHIQSCEALQEKFEEYKSYNRYREDRFIIQEDEGPFFMQEEMSGEEVMPSGESSLSFDMAVVGEALKSEAAGDFSTTNIQVEGVDEADVIKNDGEFIYRVKNNSIHIIKAYPPEAMEEVSVFELDSDFTPSELYVKDDQLVVIGRTWISYHSKSPVAMILPSLPYNGGKTKAVVLDIKDRKSPKIEREVILDGEYFSSRRIGNQLYLVLNIQPYAWILEDAHSPEDMVPRLKDHGKADEPMVGCTDIRYFPGHAQPNYMIIASVPLDDPEKVIKREVFLGQSQNIYMSQNNLYVASNETNYERFSDWDWRRDFTKTLVFKFALKNGNLNFMAKGSAPGTILNQFSMDENANHFRIATTTIEYRAGKMAPETIQELTIEPITVNHVYVLNKNMVQVGALENLARGERIFSTRFIGDRLYMVTFEQIDPLFVIDLKDPAAPKVLGELKIPGFSNYLHPYDENHILGFGKDTLLADWGGIRTAGFKMALFDVSDVTNPTMKFVEVIGEEGTSSDLLNNHKALLFDREKELLAFPIGIIEKVSLNELDCNKYRYSTCPYGCQSRCIPTSCTQDEAGRATCTTDCEGLGSCTEPDYAYDIYKTQFMGALVYTLNLTDGFKKRGEITHLDETDLASISNFSYYGEKNVERILYMGDYLYSVSKAKVKANTLDDVEEVKALNLQ